MKKHIRKKSNKKTSIKGKKSKVKKEDDANSGADTNVNDEDDLSDLDVNEDDNTPIETAENDTIIQNNEKPPRKIIDPKTPIGQLSIQDGLSYYIQLGEESCNPQLKYGALNLLKQLTGKQRRYPPRYGSKSNRNFNPRGGFQQYRGGNNGNGGGRGTYKPQYRAVPNSNEDLYNTQG
jgi:hypothetical protein